MMLPFTVCNIKLAVRINPETLKNITTKWNEKKISHPKELTKISNNGIFTFKLETKKNNFYHYNIFPSSGVINITGIKSSNEIPFAILAILKFFKKHFPYIHSIKIFSLNVHNFTAKGKINQNFHLTSLMEKYNKIKRIKDKNNIILVYNPYRFPGIRLNVKQLGCMLLYSSGKFLLVGSKNENDLETLFLKCKSFLNSLEHTLL